MRHPTQAGADTQSAGSKAPAPGLVAQPETAKGLKRLSAPDAFLPVALTYPISQWALPEDLGELPDAAKAVVPLGDACHYRIHTAETYGTGHYEFCGLDDGFFVHTNNIRLARPHALSLSAPDMLRLRIGRLDNYEYIARQGGSIDVNGPSAAIIIEPPGQPPATAVFEGESIASTILIHRKALKRLYAQRHHELPAVIQAFIGGTLKQTFATRLPLSPALLRCVDDIQGCDLDGHGRRLVIRSKAVEALCHAFDALGQADRGMTEGSPSTRRGVLKAQRMLTDHFANPPSLDQLAQAVGLSRSSLCAGFRQMVGQTVFDYVTGLRMQHALTLLNRSDASITQIAYEVGYSHPSSFALAFQRRFGATPRELRRRPLTEA